MQGPKQRGNTIAGLGKLQATVGSARARGQNTFHRDGAKPLVALSQIAKRKAPIALQRHTASDMSGRPCWPTFARGDVGIGGTFREWLIPGSTPKQVKPGNANQQARISTLVILVHFGQTCSTSGFDSHVQTSGCLQVSHALGGEGVSVAQEALVTSFNIPERDLFLGSKKTWAWVELHGTLTRMSGFLLVCLSFSARVVSPKFLAVPPNPAAPMQTSQAEREHMHIDTVGVFLVMIYVWVRLAFLSEGFGGLGTRTQGHFYIRSHFWVSLVELDRQRWKPVRLDLHMWIRMSFCFFLGGIPFARLASEQLERHRFVGPSLTPISERTTCFIRVPPGESQTFRHQYLDGLGIANWRTLAVTHQGHGWMGPARVANPLAIRPRSKCPPANHGSGRLGACARKESSVPKPSRQLPWLVGGNPLTFSTFGF